MTKRTKRPTVMIGQTASKMKSFLVKDPFERQGYALYFCRGKGKCPKGPVAQKLGKLKCDDCVKSFPGETVEQLLTRMEKGDG